MADKNNIRSTGLNAMAQPCLSLPVKTDIFIGALVAVDTDGKLILADESKSKMAVGIATKGDFPEWGEAYTIEPKTDKRANDRYLAVENFAILENPTKLYDIARGSGTIGQYVYLGKDGKISLTKGTTKEQIVGVLVDNVNRVAVRVFLNGFEA
uniref:Uncharacterized protein n=1 Tax=Ackermannviridae sp. ctaCq7 TaxID=2827294 RepID=A0A8S5R587_9CAUD|nr:MAG TPA: hypothetical protein [Ackermannviridae sp. ctaCq7]